MSLPEQCEGKNGIIFRKKRIIWCVEKENFWGMRKRYDRGKIVATHTYKKNHTSYTKAQINDQIIPK